jgi:DNA-binding response OmpR family regulator
MSGRKVLLLDDSLLCLQLESSVLAQAGFDVRTASSLHEFEHALENFTPEIILTDVRMPEMDGAALCRRLKSRLRTGHVPVILFSSLPDQALAKLAETCGADGYLSKTRGLYQLVQRIEDFCESILW